MSAMGGQEPGLGPRPDISYVIITYNDADKLGPAIASAARASQAAGMDYEVWVVDNGSVDHTAQVLERAGAELGERLRTIMLGRNTGTTFARNRALEQARGRLLCVMDSDAELPPGGLDRVDRLLADFPEVGIVGPAIILPNGKTYDSAKRFPTLMDKLRKLPNIFLGAAQVNRDWYQDFPFATVRTVHTVISCCWFMRREVFERLGPLDQRIFYAPEDVEYCLRCWKAGLAVVYYPGLRVLHHTQQVSHRRPLSRTALSHFKGLWYYWAKHRYLWRRGGLVRRYTEQLAARLDPALAAWDQSN